MVRKPRGDRTRLMASEVPLMYGIVVIVVYCIDPSRVVEFHNVFSLNWHA